jgi:hypothetical protein
MELVSQNTRQCQSPRTTRKIAHKLNITKRSPFFGPIENSALRELFQSRATYHANESSGEREPAAH